MAAVNVDFEKIMARIESPHHKTEELKRLQGEIDDTKKIISELPPCDLRSKEGASKAKHLKILYKQEEDYELILERVRVASVVLEHNELHPPPTDTEECPICLEDISGPMAFFPCCGNICCKSCEQVSKSAGVYQMTSCPLCRAKIPDDTETVETNRIKVHAENGRTWAQNEMGRRYLSGESGCPIDIREAFKWFELAAEKHSPPALYSLSCIYKKGFDGVVTQSDSRAMSLLKEAADLGFWTAQWSLAVIYYTTGEEDYMRKASFYATLAYSQGSDDAPCMLGRCYLEGRGLSKSLYRAKHYLEKAAARGDDTAYYDLARVLLELSEFQYEGAIDIAGHSCIPTVLFWLRKALVNEVFKYKAAKLIEELEKYGKQSCANCKRDSESFTETLKTTLNTCVRCKAVWYCGRDCQLKHWKDGHKTDCIKKK